MKMQLMNETLRCGVLNNETRVIPQLPPIVANYHSPVNSRIT